MINLEQFEDRVEALSASLSDYLADSEALEAEKKDLKAQTLQLELHIRQLDAREEAVKQKEKDLVALEVNLDDKISLADEVRSGLLTIQAKEKELVAQEAKLTKLEAIDRERKVKLDAREKKINDAITRNQLLTEV